MVAKENKTRYAVLGVLSIKPGSGYDIKKFCDQGIAHFWNENFGAIYPVLKQLETAGLITKAIEPGEGKPTRHVYSITAAGQEELRNWLLRPVEPAPARLELLLKLTFARNIPPENTIAELQRVQQQHQKRCGDYQALEATLSADSQVKESTGYPYWLATLRYGIYDSEFRIKWCAETIQNIKLHFDLA